MEARRALALGGLAWLVLMCAYALALVVKGRPDAATAFAYNAPIAFVFLVVVARMLLDGVRSGLAGFLRAHGGTLVVWTIGFAVLYFRLIAKNVEISGHMAWLPLLTTQAWLAGFPAWFIIVGVLSTVEALYLKLTVFGGPSGIPGTVVGLVLAATLVGLGRRDGRAGV